MSQSEEFLWRFWNNKARELAQKNAVLQAELAKAREALKPFVKQLEKEFPAVWPATKKLNDLHEERWHLNVGDFRRAREVYRALQQKEREA